MTTAVRKTLVIFGVAAAIGVPLVQTTQGLGLSAAEFSRAGDATLRAAPYAFSIWGLIYLGLAAYAVYQARARRAPALDAFGWPSVVATFACAVWIVASAMDLKAATIAIILVGAGTAILPLWRRARAASTTETLLVVAPNAMLAGWLTIASALNIVNVLTAWTVITPQTALAAALAAIGVVALVAITVALRARSWIYPLPIIWGLAAVYAAHRLDKPLIAQTAVAAALVLVVVALVAAATGRRGRKA